MKIRALSALLVVCGLVASAPAAPPLADKLPAESLLYVGWAGRGLPFDGSMVGQMIQEPATAQMVAAAKEIIEKQVPPGETQKMFVNAWDLAAITWQRPIAVALIDVEMGKRGPMPVAAILIDLGKKREDFAKHLENILEAAGDDKPEFTEATVGKVTYKTVKGPKGIVFSFGYIGDMFFAAIGEKIPGQLIQLTPEKSLKADAKFAKCFKSLSGENEQFSFYLDVAGAIRKAEALTSGPPAEPGAKKPDWPPRKIIEALGVARATALAGSVRIVERGMYTKVKLFSPAPHQGMLMPFASAALTDADLAGVPEDAIFVGAMKLSPKSALAEIRRVVGAIEPGHVKEIDDGLAEIGEQLGISIEKDILANLGDTWVLSSAPSYGGFLTGTMLTVEVKDAAKLSAAIAKIEAFARKKMKPEAEAEVDEDVPMEFRRHRRRRGPQLAIQTVKAGRVEIHCFTGNVGNFPLPVRPAWAVHKNKLYIAAWPQVIQSAIENGRKKPLTKSAAFRKLRGRVSGKASMLVYMDNRAILRYLYPLQLAGGTMGMNALMRQFGLSSSPMGPPPLSKLEKYTWPEITACSADAEGITFESYSAGFSTTSVTPLAVSALVPALFTARQKAMEAKSMANLRCIGMAFAMYQAEHNDRQPTDLGQLRPYLGTEDGQPCPVLVSPLSKRKPPKIIKGKLVGESDYVHLPLRTIRNWPNTIIVYERPENYGGKGTIVLMAGGNVGRMSMPEFRRALERSKAELKRAGGGRNSEDF